MSEIIWSKGLKNKDQYCLASTGYISNCEELYYQLNKLEDGCLWIRNNRYDLYLLQQILDRPVKLFISDGDWCFPDDYNDQYVTELLNNPYILKIFAQNYNSTKKLKKVYNYPIGLDLHTKEWFIGNYNMEKVKYMLKIRNNIKLFCAFCDCHLTPERHPDRNELYLLSNKFIEKINKRISCQEVLDIYSTSRFVISAHGGGLDCHRTWEALLCGAIVIHKHSPLDPLFEDLPVVLINNYDEITEKNMILWIDKYSSKTNIQNILKKLSYKFYKNI